MSTQRYLLLVLLAGFITMVLYLGMHQLISRDHGHTAMNQELTSIDFSKIKEEEEVKRVIREIPPKPKPQKQPPKNLKMDIQEPVDINPMPEMKMPNLDVALNGSGPFFGTHGPRAMNSDDGVIPIVKIAPRYPKIALIEKIEGWVKIQFTITVLGTVANPQVIDSNPKRVFEREAERAIMKFRFKPRIVGGQAVEQLATQTIEFKLSKK